ncbi:MAG: rRNA maturation RNase YbeY [Lachnospiraceae bacterium]|nr:rRNA maturation RNase YbeY [Lachnospiraceae bacterium]
MTILLENETALDIGVDYEEVAYKVVQAALDYVACPYECEINILLTDNQGIQQVNKQMRDMDVPTDVLSFPMLIFKTEGDFSVAEEDISSNFDAQSGELLLGDIMISLEKVVTQAEEYNHSILREYAFLIAHSILHLSGYDHIEEKERIRMEQMQEAILQSIGYTRDITD